MVSAALFLHPFFINRTGPELFPKDHPAVPDPEEKTMTTITTISRPKRRRLGIPALSGLYSALASMLANMEWRLERRRSRVALLALSDEQLKDVALSRADAYREINRRLWD